MADIRVTVNGVLGKMGQEVLRATAASSGILPVNGADIAATGKSVSIPDSADVVPVHRVSIIIAPNFAMGAVIMTHLVKEAGRFFEFADLTEVHHEAKIDSPSGTAIAIAKAARAGKESDYKAPQAEKELIENTRGGVTGGVVIHSGRMPGRVAHHEMVFASLGQTLTIRHDSINRESFMPGVIMATKASMSMSGLTVGLDKVMGL